MVVAAPNRRHLPATPSPTAPLCCPAHPLTPASNCACSLHAARLVGSCIDLRPSLVTHHELQGGGDGRQGGASVKAQVCGAPASPSHTRTHARTAGMMPRLPCTAAGAHPRGGPQHVLIPVAITQLPSRAGAKASDAICLLSKQNTTSVVVSRTARRKGGSGSMDGVKTGQGMRPATRHTHTHHFPHTALA